MIYEELMKMLISNQHLRNQMPLYISKAYGTLTHATLMVIMFSAYPDMQMINTDIFQLFIVSVKALEILCMKVSKKVYRQCQMHIAVSSNN